MRWLWLRTRNRFVDRLDANKDGVVRQHRRRAAESSGACRMLPGAEHAELCTACGKRCRIMRLTVARTHSFAQPARVELRAAGDGHRANRERARHAHDSLRPGPSNTHAHTRTRTLTHTHSHTHTHARAHNACARAHTAHTRAWPACRVAKQMLRRSCRSSQHRLADAGWAVLRPLCAARPRHLVANAAWGRTGRTGLPVFGCALPASECAAGGFAAVALSHS